MSILNRDEFFARLSKKTEGDTSPEAIAFIEDMTDTYNSLVAGAKDTEDWKARYDELDKTWRARYSHRFFSGPSNLPDDPDDGDDSSDADITITDIFK